MSFLIALLLAAPAAKQQDPKPLAAALAKALTPPQRYQGMLEQLYRPLVANAERKGGDKAKLEQAAKQTRDAAAQAMPYDDLLAWTAEVYAAHLTAAELGQLVKFYESPAGAKFTSLQPQLNSELLQKVVQVFPSRFEAAMKKP